MAKIAVFGATGNIGGHVVREALSRGHEVTALVRDPSRLDADGAGLTVVTIGDALDADAIEAAVRGHDVVVSAIGAIVSGDRAMYRKAAEAYVAAMRAAGADSARLIVVGGAASLDVAPGVRLLDTPEFPEVYKPEATAHAAVLDYYRTVSDVPWTYFSPAIEIGPGERTGSYRTGTDRVVFDADGGSRISHADYAAAMVDEIEKPEHVGERFTAAGV
jgi:putative NADH-flavin reductase